MLRWALGLALPLATLVAAPAPGAAIPGATYHGSDAAGEALTFTVSADGTRVDSYVVPEAAGTTCSFHAQGDAGEWPGSGISAQGAFEYRLYDAILFAGAFDGPQTATGSFHFFNAEVPGVKPACDTGVVTWAASTTAAVPPAGTPAPPSAPPAGGSAALVPPVGAQPGGSAPTPPGTVTASFPATFSRPRRSATRLTGRLSSRSKECVVKRRVRLTVGKRVVASVLTNADGTFTFTRTRAVRGRTVRITVTRVTRASGVCAPATSVSVHG